MPNTRTKIKERKTQPAFATADKIAAGIRKAMHEPYGNPADKTMPRLLLAVSEWLKPPDPELLLPALCEFSFSDPGHSINEIFRVTSAAVVNFKQLAVSTGL